MREFKIYLSNLRHYKKDSQITEQTSAMSALTWFSSASLASGKLQIEFKKVSESINTGKVSFVL